MAHFNVSPISAFSAIDDRKEEYKLWDYNPSIPAATVGASVFVILTVFHAFWLARIYAGFCIPIMIGGVVSGCHISYHIGNTDPTQLSSAKQSAMLLELEPTTIWRQRHYTFSNPSPPPCIMKQSTSPHTKKRVMNEG
jgi:hypothetical protein